MPIKKSNLDPDVKSKLRQAVLGEIGDNSQAPSSSTRPTVDNSLIKKAVASQPAKTGFALKSAKPSQAKAVPKPATKKEALVPAKVLASPSTKAPKKTALKKVATSAKPKPLKAASRKKTKAKKTKTIKSTAPAILSPVAGIDKKVKPVSPYNIKDKPVVYRPAWERAKKSDSSLESFFDKSQTYKKEKTSGIFHKIFTKKTPDSFDLMKSKTIKPIKSAGFFSGLLKILGLVVLLLVLLLAFDIFGVYRLGFKDQVSLNVVRYLPLPAGQVNGQMISAIAYLDDLQSLSLALSEKREGLIDYTDKTEIKDKVFYRLAANRLVEEKLKSYQNNITAEAVNSQVELLVQQAGGQPQAEKIIKDLYGLSLAQFTAKIITPMMRRENLQSSIVNDQSLAINLEAQKLAEDVLKQARVSSSDFNLLAKKYTQDEAGVNTGGELGWVVKGQLDPQWEPLIFNASSSTVLPQLVKSRFGYHIIKVEQKLVDATTKQESVKIKHILIKVDVDEYIKGLLDTANLVKYIK